MPKYNTTIYGGFPIARTKVIHKDRGHEWHKFVFDYEEEPKECLKNVYVGDDRTIQRYDFDIMPLGKEVEG